MAEVRPFCGYRYNEAKVGDLTKVICPPYDVISIEQQQILRARSPFNYIALEESQSLPYDNKQNNKYTRAAALLDKWINDGILIKSNSPVFYLHEQSFTHNNTKYLRRGIIARVRLYNWEEMTVLPHEGTLASPKADRINLLWALNANTSPVFGLFQDRDQVLNQITKTAGKSKPILDITVDGERHVLRLIEDERTIGALASFFSDKNLYIADGHHRYESALYYRDELAKCQGGLEPDHPASFVMMTLVEFNDPGLLILPPHRLLRGISESALNNLFNNLNQFFNIEKIAINKKQGWESFQQRLGDNQKIRLGLYGLGSDGLPQDSVLLLTLKNAAAVADMMPFHRSQMYKKLDVSIVDHLILEEMLGLNSHEESLISYSTNIDECFRLVNKGEYQLCFFVRAVTPHDIKTIADERDRMPRKSTYFFPKLPSGLVLNKLD